MRYLFIVGVLKLIAVGTPPVWRSIQGTGAKLLWMGAY